MTLTRIEAATVALLAAMALAGCGHHEKPTPTTTPTWVPPVSTTTTTPSCTWDCTATPKPPRPPFENPPDSTGIGKG